MEVLEAPFPWFGGKSRAAELIWDRFGDVDNYVEPFFGSGAVLLRRPTPAKTETINDLDCMVANFWRAVQQDPAAVAEWADAPVNEADQHARHLWLCSRAEFRERMKTDPNFYDPQIAGWWVWGQCIWIGDGWCAKEFSEDASGQVGRQLPHLSRQGTGVCRPSRILPMLANTGRGVHRKLPKLSGGQGVHRQFDASGAGIAAVGLEPWFEALSARLRRVRVACGDWSRVVTPAVTTGMGVTGVLLDPPYTEGDMQYAAGGMGGELASAVRKWAIENGENPDFRIALCGYEGEHAMPASWEEEKWRPRKGMGLSEEARAGRERERIWFSPGCLRPMTLFGQTNAIFQGSEDSSLDRTTPTA